MNLRKLLSSIFIFSLYFSINAQELTYGFNVGLNFSKIDGPSEVANGSDLETLKFNTGFHVGGGVIYKITDRFGAKAEILFSQKGGKLLFEGPSYVFLNTASGQTLLGTGQKKVFVDVNNAYLDIPIMGYARLGKFELSIGVSVGLLVGSTGIGSFKFDGVSPLNNAIELNSDIDYNYSKDDLFDPTDESIETTEILVDGQSIMFPTTLGAYDEYDNKDGRFFNTLDFGLIGGISFFINKGLFIGVRVNYGLSDVTNNFYDRAKSEIDADGFVPRSDKDINFSIQPSIGFSF